MSDRPSTPRRVYRNRSVDTGAAAFGHVSRMQSEQEMYDMAVQRDVALKETRDALVRAMEERDQARAEAEALRADAERLDWYARNPKTITPVIRVGPQFGPRGRWGFAYPPSKTHDTLREAIDAARSGK